MDEQEILTRLGLALAIGLLVGVERGWREREQAEGERTAGLRTFALIGLSGGIWGLLSIPLGPIPVAAAFVAFAAGMTLFKWREAESEGDFGATTLVAALLTFALGIYAVVGDMVAAAAAGVAMTALLAAKRWLHGWIETLTWQELRAALTLLVMSFVALPLLPDRGFGPYEALNPRSLWLMTIAICGVSFAGYVAVKAIGSRYGTLAAGAAGGLVSSTAATIDLARKAKADPARLRIELAGALVASSVMFLRILVVVGVFGPAELGLLVGPMLAAALVLFAIAAVLGLTWKTEPDGAEPASFRNPFELGFALRFVVLLAVILGASKWLVATFGGAGAVVGAAVAGLADVDAITLSLTQLATASSLSVTAIAIFAAAVANSVSKSVIATVAGGPAFGWRYAAATLLALGVAAAFLFAPLWFGGPLLPAA
jgi:uncharacterized membrane protein (DUF4010 family)